MQLDAELPELETLFEACLVQMETSREWFAKRILPLSLDQLRWRPRCGSWSISGYLDHLNQTLTYYLARIEGAAAANPAASPSSGGPVWTLPYGRGSKLPEAEADYLQQVEPPIPAIWDAPAALWPACPVDPGRLADEFPQLRERYANTVQSIARRGLAMSPIANTLHPPVQTIAGVLAMLAAHDRRHLWQVEQLRRSSGFPAFRGI